MMHVSATVSGCFVGVQGVVMPIVCCFGRDRESCLQIVSDGNVLGGIQL